MAAAFGLENLRDFPVDPSAGRRLRTWKESSDQAYHGAGRAPRPPSPSSGYTLVQPPGSHSILFLRARLSAANPSQALLKYANT
jgi:hypothetical protein